MQFANTIRNLHGKLGSKIVKSDSLSTCQSLGWQKSNLQFSEV